MATSARSRLLSLTGWDSPNKDQEQRMVFLAPLPEANITNGNSYGGDANGFKSAFWRIQDIFSQEFAKQKVPYDSIRWVFRP